MKHTQTKQDFFLVTALVRWIQTYYMHKFERYVATHELAA